MSEFPAFETIPGDLARGLIVLADHATNKLPPEYGALGLPPSAFQRHIAYDIGIEGVTRSLAARLGIPAVMSGFSRLLIDPNRGEDDPTLIMKISDGAIVAGNHPITPQEWQRRITRYHRPYHAAVARLISEATAAASQPPLVISLHSFTPIWKTEARPWHAAVLWDSDPRAPGPLIEALRRPGDIVIGDNQPYDGALRGDTLYRHCMQPGIAHALLEIRQDLISDEAGIRAWVDRLAPILSELNADEDLHRYRVYASRTGPYPTRTAGD